MQETIDSTAEIVTPTVEVPTESAPALTPHEELLAHYKAKAELYSADAGMVKWYYERMLAEIDLKAHFVGKGLSDAADATQAVIEHLVDVMKTHLENAKSQL